MDDSPYKPAWYCPRTRRRLSQSAGSVEDYQRLEQIAAEPRWTIERINYFFVLFCVLWVAAALIWRLA